MKLNIINKLIWVPVQIAVLMSLNACSSSGSTVVRMVFDADDLAREDDAEAQTFYNNGNGREIPGNPSGDRFVVKNAFGSEPRSTDVALTGRLPDGYGLPIRAVTDENGDPENQLFCQRGRNPSAFSLWLPAEDTRVGPSGKRHTFAINVGAGTEQRVRFKFYANRASNPSHFFKEPTDGLFLEWKQNKMYAYERDQELTDDVSQLHELESIEVRMAPRQTQIQDFFPTTLMGVHFNSANGSCTVFANGRSEVLDSRICDVPAGNDGYNLAIEAHDRFNSGQQFQTPHFVNAFCLSVVQVHSEVFE